MVDWEKGDAGNNKNVKKRRNIWGKYVKSKCGYRTVVHFDKALPIGNVNIVWVGETFGMDKCLTDPLREEVRLLLV